MGEGMAIWAVIAALAIGTFAIRLSGALLGQRLPSAGPWARALSALPGCLILAFVAASLAQGGPREWAAGALAAGVAIATRSLPLTMIIGVAAIWALRTFA